MRKHRAETSAADPPAAEALAARADQGDEYLLKLSRYVHLSPVFVGELKHQALAVRREHLRRYPWSSYRGYAGVGRRLAFMDEGPVLGMMAVPAGKRRRAYRRFVEGGLAETDAEFVELLERSGWGLGDEAFQAQIERTRSGLETVGIAVMQT